MKVLRRKLNVKEGKVRVTKQERPELGETDTGLPKGRGMNKGLLLGPACQGFHGLEALKRLLGISWPRCPAASFLG